MTQDEIIEMAMQGNVSTKDIVRWAVNEAEKTEREACARILEQTDLSGIKDNPSMQKWVADMLLAYANAIRARGEA